MTTPDGTGSMPEREPKPDTDELSTFDLDVYWASGRPADAKIDLHVESCERCRSYLADLDKRSQALPAPPVTRLASARRASPHGRWMLWAGGALAAAAALVLFVRTSAGPRDYVGSKGTPAVQLLVHRDGDTHVWDGRSAVRPGDALAVKVACEGLAYVTVAAPSAGSWSRLSDAPCPSTPDALPFTLRVDDEPGNEELAVVLSRKPESDAALRSAIGKTERSDDAWVVRYVLPKETGGAP